jgi:transcription initiation factor TFIIF subunit beta
LKISKVPGQKAQVSLSLSDSVMKIDNHEKIPKDHKLDVSVVTKQTLGVFSHLAAGSKEEVAPESEKLFMEGRIVQKLECRPIPDDVYMNMKLASIKKASIPARQVQSLDKIVQNFKPVSDHDFNVSSFSCLLF